METFVKRVLVSVMICGVAGCSSGNAPKPGSGGDSGEAPLRLGNFSVSLAVKDLAASRAFYEKLGFRVKGGDAAKNWLVLQNETSTTGLFQGMFEKNSLTFNPGWDRNSKALSDFDDVREIQRTLKRRGVTLAAEADESAPGGRRHRLMIGAYPTPHVPGGGR